MLSTFLTFSLLCYILIETFELYNFCTVLRSAPLVGRVLDKRVLELDVNVTFKTDLESTANCVMNKYDSSLTSKQYMK